MIGREHLVLVIDRDNRIVEECRRLLGNERYELSITVRGDEALRILRDQEVAVLVSDEAVLCDEKLPMLEFLTEYCPRTQRIVFTGWPQGEADWDKIRKCRPFSVVSKPDVDNRLRKAIRAAIREHEKTG